MNACLGGQAAVRVKHQHLIGASAGGIPLSSSVSARFAAPAASSAAIAHGAAAWGAADDDIDLSDDDDSE
jgi:hypothetical protein